MTTQDKQREQRLIRLRDAALAAGTIGAATGATTSHAAISAADVTQKYTDSGAEDTIDGVGIVIIGLAIGITVVSLIVGLVKKK